MNMIEELGGYEKACKFCDKEIKNDGYPHELIAELLEYRRANNLYEVGDLVVRVNKSAKGHLWKIVGLSDVFAKESFVCDTGAELLRHFHKSEIKHASKSEIKVGHRL